MPLASVWEYTDPLQELINRTRTNTALTFRVFCAPSALRVVADDVATLARTVPHELLIRKSGPGERADAGRLRRMLRYAPCANPDTTDLTVWAKRLNEAAWSIPRKVIHQVLAEELYEDEYPVVMLIEMAQAAMTGATQAQLKQQGYPVGAVRSLWDILGIHAWREQRVDDTVTRCAYGELEVNEAAKLLGLTEETVAKKVAHQIAAEQEHPMATAMPKNLDRNARRRRIGTFDYLLFGEDLRRQREASGTSLRQLAATLGVGHTVLYRIETADTNSPDLELVLQLCQMYDLALDDYWMVPASRTKEEEPEPEGDDELRLSPYEVKPSDPIETANLDGHHRGSIDELVGDHDIVSVVGQEDSAL